MLTPQRLQRDLAWCLHSPPLLLDPSHTDTWPDDRWFRELALPPDIEVPAPRHPHHFRLGQQFEQLLGAWLKAAPGFELLAANLQVQDGKRTVGEFDFLVDVAGRVEHWEAAVKFYLGTGDCQSLDCWYGPNTADRFDIKYERLVHHQLALTTNSHAHITLASQDIKVDRVRCFMKGRLFHPWQTFEAGAWRYPDLVNPAHEKGWWLAETDFLPTFEDSHARFVYLPKSLWLAPLDDTDFDAPLSCWEVAEILSSPHTEQASHYAIVSGKQELSRGFIVKNQWLERLT